MFPKAIAVAVLSSVAAALLIVSAASAASSSISWSDKGPFWTKTQARAALLDARRIYALRTPGVRPRPYVFKVTAITAMRADGPSARVNGVPAWRRFVVWVRLNPLVDVPTSYWNYRDVSFCLHAGKPWRLTGFDTATSRANYTPYGCQDSAEARLQGGGPSR